jgi:cytochrome c556
MSNNSQKIDGANLAKDLHHLLDKLLENKIGTDITIKSFGKGIQFVESKKDIDDLEDKNLSKNVAEEIKCKACHQSFTVQSSLNRHLEQNKVCVNWINGLQKFDNANLINLPQNIDDMKLTKFTCEACHKPFIGQSSLNRHLEQNKVCANWINLPKKIDDMKLNKFTCEACHKSFTVESSLNRHLERSTVCVNWINLPKKIDETKLKKGIHLIIDELLEKSIGNDGELECKYCNMTFTNKGNHHKHFNTATVCNRLAFLEFNTLLNDI